MHACIVRECMTDGSLATLHAQLLTYVLYLYMAGRAGAGRRRTTLQTP
jgi:hypothetical protein